MQVHRRRDSGACFFLPPKDQTLLTNLHRTLVAPLLLSISFSLSSSSTMSGILISSFRCPLRTFASTPSRPKGFSVYLSFSPISFSSTDVSRPDSPIVLKSQSLPRHKSLYFSSLSYIIRASFHPGLLNSCRQACSAYTASHSNPP